MATSKSTEEKPKQPPTGQKLIEKEKAATGRVGISNQSKLITTVSVRGVVLLLVQRRRR